MVKLMHPVIVLSFLSFPRSCPYRNPPSFSSQYDKRERERESEREKAGYARKCYNQEREKNKQRKNTNVQLLQVVEVPLFHRSTAPLWLW
jgi:hypothetical protein